MMDDDALTPIIASVSEEDLARIISIPIPTARPQEVHVDIPGATSRALRHWAEVIEGANQQDIEAGISVTDHPFMGVELTLHSRGERLLVLTLFGDVPDDEERKTMEADDTEETEP